MSGAPTLPGGGSLHRPHPPLPTWPSSRGTVSAPPSSPSLRNRVGPPELRARDQSEPAQRPPAWVAVAIVGGVVLANLLVIFAIALFLAQNLNVAARSDTCGALTRGAPRAKPVPREGLPRRRPPTGHGNRNSDGVRHAVDPTGGSEVDLREGFPLLTRRTESPGRTSSSRTSGSWRRDPHRASQAARVQVLGPVADKHGQVPSACGNFSAALLRVCTTATGGARHSTTRSPGCSGKSSATR